MLHCTRIHCRVKLIICVASHAGADLSYNPLLKQPTFAKTRQYGKQ